MAKAATGFLAGRDVVLLRSSPLDRARETAAPLAAQFGLEPEIDERLIEPTNVYEGTTFGVGSGALRHPADWRYLYNPFRPSWGEPYKSIAARMLAAMADAARAARGHEVVCVSHQLPIYTARRAVEGQHLWHDPRTPAVRAGQRDQLPLPGGHDCQRQLRRAGRLGAAADVRSVSCRPSRPRVLPGRPAVTRLRPVRHNGAWYYCL